MTTPPAWPPKGGGRFQLRKRLGEGGFGVVYEAFDTRRNTTVALKALRRFDVTALLRFKQEFRSLADVDHPNLVSLYELFADGDDWFFTMELVAGHSFTHYVRDWTGAITPEWLPIDSDDDQITRTTDVSSPSSPSRPPTTAPTLTRIVDLDRLRSTIGQIAQALCEIHAIGILHRDIKPSNVLVTPEGRVVVLDFGLVTQLADAEAGDAKRVLGTPAYMSPEQSIGQDVAEPTDWYSLGVMLYEALAGELPFKGSTVEIVLAKQSADGPRPSLAAPGLPEDLSSLCEDLLRRDPSARPAGAEVLRRLALPSATTLGVSTSTTGHHDRRLVGRAQHLAALEDGFDTAATGRAVVTWVEGPSGIGKSALIRRFLRSLRERSPNAVVLTGRCHQQESVPYKAIDGLIDHLAQYLTRLSDLEAARVVPRDAVALARLFPVLREVPAITNLGSRVADDTAAQEVRRRAFTALRDLFRRLAAEQPLVLYIDDLQWGDLDSGLLLAEALRPPDPPAMLLVASYRSEDRAASPLLNSLIASLGAKADGRESRAIAVGELSDGEATALALDVLGEHPRADVLAAAIARDARGNPFLVDELARRALETGEIIGLDRAVQTRVAALGSEARQLLELLAVAGQPLDADVAGSASTFGGDTQAVVRQLRARRLLRTGGPTDAPALETYHDRIREAVVASLDPESLRARHASLAGAWEATGRADPEVLLTHYQGAGDRHRAGHYAMKAAELADHALAFDRAARLYQMAIDLLGASGRQAAQLRERRGQALANAGRGPEAAAEFLQAWPDSDPAAQPDIERRAAEQFLRFGHLEQGLEVLGRVLRRFGMKVASTPQRALVSVLFRRGLARLRGTRFEEREASAIAPELLLQLDTCWSVGGALGMTDIIRGADLQLRHLSLALKVGEPHRVAQALSLQISNSATGGAAGVPRTRALTRQTLELAERLDDPFVRGQALLGAGVAAKLEGRCHDCVDTLQRSLDQLESCVGVAWERQMCHMFIIESLAVMGNWEEMRKRMSASLVDAEQRGDRYFLTYLRSRPSALDRLIQDDPDGAIAQTRIALDGWAAAGFDVPHLYAFYSANQAMLYAGRADEAWASIARTIPLAKKALLMFAHVFRVEVSHLRGRTALEMAARHPGAKYLNEAEHEARRLEKEKLAWSTALATLMRAGVEAGRGRREDAARRLITAHGLFKAARMDMYAAASARARGLLIAGDEGSRLVALADQAMLAQRVVNPARMARMLAPGAWDA